MPPAGHTCRSTGHSRPMARTLGAAGAAVGSTSGLRRQGIHKCNRRRSVIGAAYHPPRSPRPLSELLSGQHPRDTHSSSTPTSSSSSASASAAHQSQRAAAPAAAAAAAVAAAGSSSMRRAAGRSPSPGLGFSVQPALPGPPRGLGPLLSPPGAPALASSGPAATSAAAPHPFTAAPPYEAFEPGDTGFAAPTTAEVVTSSSGSVMVKVSAFFSGQPGDKVLVCGGCKALGHWEPDAAPTLTWGEGDVWTATLELPAGTHEFKSVALKPVGAPIWEPGNNRRVSVPRPGGLAGSSGDEIDLVLGLLEGDAAEAHPEAQLVETSGGSTMVKLTTTYTAAFGEYLKVVGGPSELGGWDAGAAPALTWSEGDVWTATLELPAGEHEFKYVVVRQDGRLEWEPGENRRIHVPLPGLAAALAAAKASVAAEEAAGGGAARAAPAGRKLSPQEVYQRQEAAEQLEPWQQAAAPAAANGHKRQESMPAAAEAAPAAAAAAAAPVSAGWREVKISTKFAAQFGTFLKVCGAPEQLGGWDVVAAPPLQWAEGDSWSLTLLLPPGAHEFKLVVVLPTGAFDWESGPNRVLTVEPATSQAEQAAGVLHAECQYGETAVTSSLWASLDEEQEPAAAVALPAPEQQQQQQRPPAVQPADWYSKQAEAIAAAAEQQAAAAEAAAAAAPPPPPPRPLQPLDAVVKVFKDKFAAPAPPVTAAAAAPEPPSSRSPIASFIEASLESMEEEEEGQEQQQQKQQLEDTAQQPQQPQQQQQQQPSDGDLGGRFASIIASRKQQQPPPAVLFMDRKQQDEQQQRPPEQDTAGSSSSSDGDRRFDSVIFARQQQPGPIPPWEQQPAEGPAEAAALPPWESSQQQQIPPTPPDAASSADRWSSSVDTSGSSSSSKGYTSWRASPPPVQQQRDAAASSSSSSSVHPAVEQWKREREQQQAGGASSSGADGSSSSSSVHPAVEQWKRERQQQQQAGTGSRDSSSTVHPAAEQWKREREQQQPPVTDSSVSSSQIHPAVEQWKREREQRQQQPPVSETTSSSSSVHPAVEQWKRDRQQQQQQPVRDSAASSSSSSTGVHPAVEQWQRERQQQQQQQQQQLPPDMYTREDYEREHSSRPTSPSWRSPSPVQDSSSSAAADSPPSPSGRFSKYTSGSSWRSASSAQERQLPQQQQQQQQQQQPESPPSPDSIEGGRFSNYIASQKASSSSSSPERRFPSSWDAVEAGGGRGGGADYLYELGQSDFNTNVDAGQHVGMIDSLFTGGMLGQHSDIADGSLRGWEARTLNHIIGDYYIAPKFMDKVAMHITKNYLCDQGAISKSRQVPLILGIWGPKGCGKTFQTELAFKKLGVEPVVLSAGELESETAGQPGRLIRERYRKAAELGKTRGKLSCLLINDLDAGIGRFGNTQVTVNNQIVIGTLMNICDTPNQVSLGAGWREHDTIRRVPIIVTGNDFSTLYAPLIRDGRMEKFYWQPEQEDIVSIVWQMYKDDGLSRHDIEALVGTFSNQALDFFGALRAAHYDAQIRDWMASVAGAPLHAADAAKVKEVNKRLLHQQDLPEFEPVPVTLPDLIAEGQRLVAQQDLVNSSKLGEEYMKGVAWGASGKGAWSSSDEDDDLSGRSLLGSA